MKTKTNRAAVQVESYSSLKRRIDHRLTPLFILLALNCYDALLTIHLTKNYSAAELNPIANFFIDDLFIVKFALCSFLIMVTWVYPAEAAKYRPVYWLGCLFYLVVCTVNTINWLVVR